MDYTRDLIHLCVTVKDCCWKVWPCSTWVVFLTVLGPRTRPCHTDLVTSLPGRRWLRRPPIEIQLQRRWLCRPPAAQIRTPHSAPLCTTSFPQHDTWDDDGKRFPLRIGGQMTKIIQYLNLTGIKAEPNVAEHIHQFSSVLSFFFCSEWLNTVKINDWILKHGLILSQHFWQLVYNFNVRMCNCFGITGKIF